MTGLSYRQGNNSENKITTAILKQS